METIKELELSEMIAISGGVNPAYEIGYAIGSCLRKLILIESLLRL
jgi:hypothetical protein